MFLRMKHKKLIKQMKGLEVSDKALFQYKTCVKGNNVESDELLIKKLKRNYVLAERVDYYSYRFGNLYINVDSNIIKSIYNVKGKYLPYNVNDKLKAELDKILGI